MTTESLQADQRNAGVQLRRQQPSRSGAQALVRSRSSEDLYLCFSRFYAPVKPTQFARRSELAGIRALR